MAAQQEINLLPQEEWEKKPLGRVVKWALTIGRYIVITTELIVIVVFVSRFKLDRDLSDLYEKVEIKQAQIKTIEEFEKDFRQIQKRLKTIAEIKQRDKKLNQLLTEVGSFVPRNLVLFSIDLQEDKLTLKGQSLNEQSLAYFLNKLKNSPNFTEVKVDSISKERKTEINFSLTSKLKI